MTVTDEGRRLLEAMTSRSECPHGYTDVRHVAPFHFEGKACPDCSDAEYADRMQREEPCVICSHLPAFLAAVEALQRLVGVGDSLWEEHPVAWMNEADAARAALAPFTEEPSDANR